MQKLQNSRTGGDLEREARHTLHRKHTSLARHGLVVPGNLTFSLKSQIRDPLGRDYAWVPATAPRGSGRCHPELWRTLPVAGSGPLSGRALYWFLYYRPLRSVLARLFPVRPSGGVLTVARRHIKHKQHVRTVTLHPTPPPPWRAGTKM